MPIVPIKTRLFTDPIDPELLLFIDARYIESYNGGLTASNLAIGNVENTGDGVIVGNVTYDTEEGGCFIMNGGFIDFTPSSITLEGTLGTGKGTNDLQISNRDNWSISAFVKPTRSQQAQYSQSNIFDTSNSNNSPFSVYYGTFGKSERFGFGGGFFDTTDSSRTYPINEWYHVVWTKQKISNQASVSHRYRLYINGVLQDDTGPRYNGGQPYKVCRIGFGFRGKIAQVKIFNKTLTPAQVIQDFSSARVKLSSIGTKKTSSDIILYLNEKGTSAGWGDNSMYSNGARLFGNVSFDNGLVGNGTLNSYAEGTLSQSPGQNFTISVLFEIYGAGSDPVGQNLFISSNSSLGAAPTPSGFGLIYMSTKNILFAWANNAYILSTPNQINYNQKTQVTATYNGTTFKIYINGVLQNSNTPSPTVIFNFTNRTYNVGYWKNTGFERPLNGKIFNVILHNRTLSDAEVKKLYAALPTTYKSNESTYNQEPTSDRILYVDGAEPKSYYAETGGLSFKDLSGFSRNGTLSRATRLQLSTTVTGTYPEFKKFNAGYFYFNGFLTSNPINPDQTGNSYISFPTTFLPSDSSPSTIIAWARAKPSTSGEYRYIFSYGTYNANGQNRYVGIKYPSVSDPTSYFSIGGAGVANGATILNEPGMVVNEWFQIAFVYINAEMRLFVNGQLLNIKSSTLITTTPFRSAFIGRSNTLINPDTSNTDGYFYGDIAQVLVYNRALNEQEIYQHYKVTRDRFGSPIVQRPTSVSEITLPVVTTVAPYEIITTSAKSGVIINFNGNSTILASGILIRLKTQTGAFEWGGTGVTNIPGTNPISITSLSPSTNYEIRAYAYNGTFYGYGQPLDLTATSPSVLTVLAVTASFTGNYATASGQVTDLGGNINGYKTRGFVWSTSTINVSNADLISNRAEESKDGTPFWTDLNEQWKLRVTPLLSGTTYYLRSYAKIENGSNVYSNNELVFTTYTFPILTVTIPIDPAQITSNIANISGSVTGGTQPILQRGIVWTESTVSQDPTIEIGSETTSGSGTGTFTGTLNGLLPGRTYYVKAYAISIAGVAYSSVASFTTDTTPAVTTVDMSYDNLYRLGYVISTLKQSATASGSITNINGDPISEVGVVWSTLNTNIDINTNQGKVSLTTGITNDFDVKIPDLTINTLYYFRAYAVNSVGVSYGTIKQFKTLGTSTPTGLPTVTRVFPTPSEINSPGSVTLRAFVDKTAFGNSDFYGEPLTVGFLYTVGSNPFTRVVVDTNYLLSDAQSVPPANYFTTDLILPTGFNYIIRAFSQFKGYPFDVVGESIFSWNLGVYNFPTLTTRQAISISFSGAQSGGDISSNGGDVVISRGVVWTIDDFVDPVYPGDSNIDLFGSGVGYNAAITGLEEGTTYYYRAFARNNTGVGYGNKETFTTTSRVGVATNPATSVTANSATLNGTTTIDLGGYTDIDEVGFYWSTLQADLPPQPAVDTVVTTTATKVVAGTNVLQPSAFSATITLTPGVTYYYVAYTKNPAGTSIGLPTRNFSTTSVIKTTVTIGSQGTITNTSIQINSSNVTNTGGGTVTARGVCWSTSQFPVLGASNFTSDGSGSGSFNSSITGLLSGTIYYVRAYATNEAGTSYSSGQLTITTFVITTGTVENSFSNKLDVNGSNIVWDTPSITARGVVWDILPNPTVTLTTKTSNGSGTGLFNSPNIQILSASTTYYIRAYVIHTSGTFYGSQIQFTTPAHPNIITSVLMTLVRGINRPGTTYPNYSLGTTAQGSYQEFKISTSSGLSNLWIPGFVISTSANTPATLEIGDANTINQPVSPTTRLPYFARYDSTGTDIYAGPLVTTATRPWYVRTYLTDGVNVIYSSTIRAIHMPQLPIFTPTSNVDGTITVTITLNSMQPGSSPAPVVNKYGYVIIDVNNTVTHIEETSSLVSNQYTRTIDTNNPDVQPFITSGTAYRVNAWVEYLHPDDGTIRIYSQTANQNKLTVTQPWIRINSSPAATVADTTITGISVTITYDGGATVTARGVVWSTTQNPTVALTTKTTDGTGTGTFTSNITGLSPSTTYYVRAYATNTQGTSYSNQVSFTTTSLTIPTVTLASILDLFVDATITNGTMGGVITMTLKATGISGNPTQMGFDWSTSPTFLPGRSISNTTGGSNNDFIISLNNTNFGQTVNVSTTYYIRAVAIKLPNTIYSSPIQTFHTFVLKLNSANSASKGRLSINYTIPSTSQSIQQIDLYYYQDPIVIVGQPIGSSDVVWSSGQPALSIGAALSNTYLSQLQYTSGYYIRFGIKVSGFDRIVYSNQIQLV